jgi:hypothetical protein
MKHRSAIVRRRQCSIYSFLEVGDERLEVRGVSLEVRGQTKNKASLLN